MDWISNPEIWIALATLTFLEIVLGVDNIIFISILSGKLPPEQQPKARRLGLLGAMGTRVLLLFSLAWIVRLTAPLFTALGHPISGRDLIYAPSRVDAIVGPAFGLVVDVSTGKAAPGLIRPRCRRARRHSRIRVWLLECGDTRASPELMVLTPGWRAQPRPDFKCNPSHRLVFFPR